MKNIGKLIVLFSFLAILLSTSSYVLAQKSSDVRPEVGEYAEVYRGEKNLQVTIVRLGKREDKEALIEIVGIDHPWDKRIFRAKVNDYTTGSDADDKKIDYKIKVNGVDYSLIAARGYGRELYLRENGDSGKESSYNLYYSKALSEDSKPEFLLTAYLEQEEKAKDAPSKKRN